MHQHSEIVLAQTKTTSLCMYVVWAFGLVVFNLVVIAFVRGMDGVSCVFAVTPAMFFLGSIISHFRSRRCLVAAADGLVWLAPASSEFLGGIARQELKWSQIESMVVQNQAPTSVGSDNIIIMSVQRSPSDSSCVSYSDQGGDVLKIGEVSWQWTKSGTEFLVACGTFKELCEWRRNAFGVP